MNYKGLNSFNIKIIALMLMTIDHIGYFFSIVLLGFRF